MNPVLRGEAGRTGVAQANGADIKGGTWFETGAEMLGGGTLNYFAVPWGIVNNPLPLALIVIIEVALLGATENYRCAAQHLLQQVKLRSVLLWTA